MTEPKEKRVHLQQNVPWACPLQPEREALKSSEDIGERVCGHVADAWLLQSALTIVGMSEVDWKRWLQDEDNKRTHDRAKGLHRLRIEGELRAIGIGLTFRRAQLPALRMLLRGLDSEKRPMKRDRGTSPSDAEEHPDLPADMGPIPLDNDSIEALRQRGWADDDDDGDVDDEG